MKTTSQLTKTLSYSVGCSRVISQNTFCRFSATAALCNPACFLWSVLFHAFLFFIYLMFYSFFDKISTAGLNIIHNFIIHFLCNLHIIFFCTLLINTLHLIFHSHPSATSRSIIRVNPPAKKIVPILECFPADISGINSSTTT